jgi:chromosome segregation protein
VRLKSLTLKGFKSFPDRTQLDFGPGVSVVVGPNGSGKSNITDAVLWAMGEQSPLAVRGSSMQDVIFGGAPGVQARSAAEVEIVLENSDDGLDLPVSEISIVRRLERAGEGSYRLNGARCRLGDVIEALSDTGLGKETHSVISQGRVESIVTSKPHDRRLLIEEAAGLGKHRKRRRRARLKLERTQQNLDRALDVEREARSRLRPLKRQAEAAELRERLERQMLEARLALARERGAQLAGELAAAQRSASQAREARGEVQATLAQISERRSGAERALAERASRHDALARVLLQARSAQERLALRKDQVAASVRALQWRMARAEQQLTALQPQDGEAEPGGEPTQGHVDALQAQLAEIEARREGELQEQLRSLLDDSERQQEALAALEQQLATARAERERAEALVAQAREGSVWSATWQEVRRVIGEGIEHALALDDAQARARAAGEVAEQAEHVARGVVEYALKGLRAAEDVRERAEEQLREAERARSHAAEEHSRTQWLIEQRRAAEQQGPLAVRVAQLQGELAAERRQQQHAQRQAKERQGRVEALRERQRRDEELLPRTERLAAVLADAAEAATARVAQVQTQLAGDGDAGEDMAAQLRSCAAQEAEAHAQLEAASEAVTEVEVAAQRVRDQAHEAQAEVQSIVARLGISEQDASGTDGERLDSEQLEAISARLERLQRRAEQLGPVNPLAAEEYAAAVEHVEEMEARREDLETGMRELRGVIADTDREIQRSFQETFQAAAENFSRLAAELFPGGSGRLRLISEAHAPRAVLGGQPLDGETGETGETADSEQPVADDDEFEDAPEDRMEFDTQGVEIEITPAGKTTKRLSLLSGGEKSMTALAFLFAVFLARPCPFYILDEVEAALDDLNLDRFLALLRRYSDRAQFIVITHQKRTMEAADWLYGVSMGGDGVSKVVSRRLPAERTPPREVAALA